MANTAPVIDFRNPASLASPLPSLAFLGNAPNGAIPIGGTSSPLIVRIYNNYAGAANIADATNCVLSTYDAIGNQGIATLTPVVQQWLQAQVNDFNGITTNADTQFYPIGGTTVHSVPVNSATLPGSTANYFTVTYQIVVPSSASGAAYSQGVFLEYNYNL